MHPFISSMVSFLKLGGDRSRRAAFMAPFYRADDAQFFADIEYMRTLSQEIIDKRVQHPEDTKDPRSGKSLSQGTIIDNLITFLIAGHET